MTASDSEHSPPCAASKGTGLMSYLGGFGAAVATAASNVNALLHALSDSDGPCSSTPLSASSVYEDDGAIASHSLRTRWLLVSAEVDTSGGGCILLDPDTDEPLEPGPDTGVAPDPSFRRYPRHGSFDLFCGLVIDATLGDGSVVTFRSPFARNASAHVHTELVLLPPQPVAAAPHGAAPASSYPLRSIRVSVFNNGPGTRVPITVRDVSLLPLPVHPGWVPPQRLVAADAASAKATAGWMDPRRPVGGAMLALSLLRDRDYAASLYLGCPLRDAEGALLLVVIAVLLAAGAAAGGCSCLLAWHWWRRHHAASPPVSSAVAGAIGDVAVVAVLKLVIA